MFADNLEFVSVLVVGSNINTNDRGKEQLTFLISIGQEVQGEFDDMYPHDEAQELWRVEKQYSDFVNLDSKVQHGCCSFVCVDCVSMRPILYINYVLFKL